MLMLFPKGDPREAFQIAADAEQEKALRAQGYKALDESGLHPDQFREDVKKDAPPLPSPEVKSEDVAPIKRGPGRPRKES